MSRFILTASMVWVGLSLIIGILFVSGQRSVIFLNAENSERKEVQIPEKTLGESVTSARTQVQIAGTPIGETTNVPTKLKIKQ